MRALSACVPAFLPGPGETPSPEALIRALPANARPEREPTAPGMHVAHRRWAWAALRCWRCSAMCWQPMPRVRPVPVLLATWQPAMTMLQTSVLGWHWPVATRRPWSERSTVGFAVLRVTGPVRGRSAHLLGWRGTGRPCRCCQFGRHPGAAQTLAGAAESRAPSLAGRSTFLSRLGAMLRHRQPKSGGDARLPGRGLA